MQEATSLVNPSGIQVLFNNYLNNLPFIASVEFKGIAFLVLDNLWRTPFLSVLSVVLPLGRNKISDQNIISQNYEIS